MREIDVSIIEKKVSELCIKACTVAPPDIQKFMGEAISKEDGLALQVIQSMLENHELSQLNAMPLCQDTGLVVVFLKIGQDVRLVGGDITEAINAGVRHGYDVGYLRKSVVADPIRRINTKDNTPAIIHYEIVPGSQIELIVSPKGFGSENMSRLKMLVPSDGIQTIKDFAIETVRLADSNACPPIIVGIGIGGDFESCAIMAKKALLRELGQSHPDPFWAKVEQELLEEINSLGIGPAGLGGYSTAMGVHINTFATHIAGLPLAVNLGCHVNRHEGCTI